MPIIQIEQDSAQLQADARAMIVLAAENIRQSFVVPEPQGGLERIIELTTTATYGIARRTSEPRYGSAGIPQYRLRRQNALSSLQVTVGRLEKQA